MTAPSSANAGEGAGENGGKGKKRKEAGDDGLAAHPQYVSASVRQCSQLTIHVMPNRSTSIPNPSAQNVFW